MSDRPKQYEYDSFDGYVDALDDYADKIERKRDEARDALRELRELRDAFERFYGFPNCSRARILARDALTKAKEVLEP